MSGLKRVAHVPPAVRFIGAHVSKADLLEACWYLAQRLHGDEADEAGAIDILVEELEIDAAARDGKTRAWAALAKYLATHDHDDEGGAS